MSSETTVLKGFNQVSDVGLLKVDQDEYSFLQNVRGWGGAGRKRRGIETVATFSNGIMGIHDLRNDGDAGSQDKILVVLSNGDLATYSMSEL